MKRLGQKYEETGYLVLANHFTELDLQGFDLALKSVIEAGVADVYNDRSGNLRRLEQFVRRHDFFVQLNEKVESLLLEVTGRQHTLFKDKINFKPPGGEGFSAHYDGVFQFNDGHRQRNGWYEYAQNFVSVLIALDDFTIENGALEVADKHRGSFETLLRNTKQDGSPDLIDDVIRECHFNPIIIEKGGVVIFSNLCPHRSMPNRSNRPRGSLYFTYNESKDGDNYSQYFVDKRNSSNKFKALTGEMK